MKNQYFGDLNDYAKYGILRALGRRLRIAVIWMLTPDDESNDGKKTGYLESRTIAAHDPALHDWLKHWYRGDGRRDLSLIEQSGLLPNCQFFSDVVPDGVSARAEWGRRARQFYRDSDLVFFDPDNGLPVKSTRPGKPGWSKYVSLEEVKRAYDEGHSVLVYQHVARIARRPFIAGKLRELADALDVDRIVTFSSFNWIAFLIGRDDHIVQLDAARHDVTVNWRDRIHVESNQIGSVLEEAKLVKSPRVARESKGTTRIGYVNSRGQEVIDKTGLEGTDHGQLVYVLRCRACKEEYGANGSDIFQRRCPVCQGGAPGLATLPEPR